MSKTTMELETAAPSWITRTQDYYEDVKSEMRRVSWPTWPQVRSTTIVVLISVFMLAGYFALVDMIVNAGVTRLINFFSS